MKNNKKLSIFTHSVSLLINNIAIYRRNDTNMLLFAFEGILITMVNNFINNNNNLFASRLGASDFQLSLVTSLPQFVGMIVLIPGGILTDQMVNKRKMVILSLSSLAIVYFILGFVPMMRHYGLTAFLVLLALSIGPMTLYNSSWQAYFSDIVPIKKRNKTFTIRTRWTFLINFIAPLLTGTLLTLAVTNKAKLMIHQSFFWISCILIIFQVFVLKKISGDSSYSHSDMRLKDVKKIALDLINNKGFLGFVGVALFFYMTWQSDWTLYYIEQVTYLKLNEAWLSFINVGGAAIQFITISFWSHVNEKHGIRFSIIIGSLGLCFFPLVMILSTSLPLNIGPIVFLILSTLSNFAFATVSLNILQCLLQVIPEKNKTLSISIYTVFISLSNAVMPMVGIKLYTILGSNLHALHTTFLIILLSRAIATALWTLRWWLLRNTPK